MTMIALDWGQTRVTPDLALAASGAVAREDGLRTAILLSLFLDARASAEDPLPDPLNRDRRGWVGDALAPRAGDRIGSRLWLLAREKQNEATRLRAEIYAREALAWMTEEGLARSVSVTAAWVSQGQLGLRVQVAELSFDETFGVLI